MRLSAGWLLLACALLGAVLGGAYGVLRTTQYTATSYVIAVAEDKADPTTALGFAQAYGRVATQLAVLGDAQVRAGVPVDTLRASVRTATSPDAPMVAVSASAANPAQAADMANAVSQALTKNANRTRTKTGVQLMLFSRAAVPTSPATSSPVVTALVGTCAGGLLAGLGLLARPRPRHAGPGSGSYAGAGTGPDADMRTGTGADAGAGPNSDAGAGTGTGTGPRTASVPSPSAPAGESDSGTSSGREHGDSNRYGNRGEARAADEPVSGGDVRAGA
ncbi:lipopolysaccharide biosynthesis protein [Streptomyces sp. NA04227]|nr:lipopolysaccharide biosynthesis protein [Streptomyces sp. NA04227]